MFKLNMNSREGNSFTLVYDPHLNTLKNSDGSDILSDEKIKEFRAASPTSELTPNPKSRSVKNLKIQLGLGCNYSCSYCSQSSFIKQATASSISDAKNFINKVSQWFDAAPSRVELWGGEPLLYLNKIKFLVPKIKEIWPESRISMVTNGSLLDDSVVDFIEQNNISIAISHDGPGQHLRGPDPLDDHGLLKIWSRLLAKSDTHHINSVLSSDSFDLIALRDWFAQKFDHPVRINIEGVVNVYDADTLNGSGRFSSDKLKELTSSVFYSMESNEPLSTIDGLDYKVHDFIHSLFQRRPVNALWQKCGMDRPDHIAVDLQGNVMTCQNTGAKGSHKIGHLDAFDDIKLTTSTHLTYREECMSCPVVQLCKGGCMYLKGDYFNQTCHNEFAYNLGIMMAALHRLTGAVIVSMEGQMVRPPLPAG